MSFDPHLIADLRLLDSRRQPLLDAIKEEGQLLQRPAKVLGDVRLESVAVLLLHVFAEAVQRGYLHPEQTREEFYDDFLIEPTQT